MNCQIEVEKTECLLLCVGCLLCDINCLLCDICCLSCSVVVCCLLSGAWCPLFGVEHLVSHLCKVLEEGSLAAANVSLDQHRERSTLCHRHIFRLKF